jgi:pimeloyl-ACP methyl ester carboxylesterase
MLSYLKIGTIFIFSIILVSFIILLVIREVKQKEIVNKSNEIISNGGISRVEVLEIGGVQQHILLEGADQTNPVCVFIHGGPGSPFPFGVSSRTQYSDITESCTAVFYDQRGSGKSYNKTIDLKTMNINQFISDANEVVDFARTTFKQEKVYLVGTSFGSIIGTNLVHRYPEKIHAYISFGQVTNSIEGQKLAFKWLFDEANNNEDKKTLKLLNEIGEAPYYGEEEGKLGDLLNKYPGYIYSDDKTEKPSVIGLIKGAFISPDYSLADIYKALISGPTFSMFKSKDLQNEIINTNLFETVPDIKTAVYFFQGKHDKATNYELAREYFDSLKSPEEKKFITLENSAHYPNTSDFEIFKKGLIQIVEKK